MKAGIIGATGYSGVELIRLLHQHPHLDVAALYSTSKEGANIADVYPQLAEAAELPLQALDPAAVREENDVVFLAAPSGAASRLAPELVSPDCLVIDLSGDFRLKSPAEYRKWYKKDPGPDNILQKAVYGLSEWNESHIQNASFIANPGCYPTAVLLGILPLVHAGSIRAGSLVIDAKSGISGAGRSASAGSLYSELNENLKIYKVNEHQHIPEIEQMLALSGYEAPITFSTHLAPMTRGIMATIYAELQDYAETEQLLETYQHFYRDKSFVRVRKPGDFPAVKEVTGSNYCDIGLAADPRTGRVTIVSVIDNIVKGAAGQAIQNANIRLGFEETAGLDLLPVYP